MYEQPGFLIRRAHQKAAAAFSSATRELDLTPVQFSSLLAIKYNPDIDATRVSELISFDRTTIGHVLGRLERKRLIQRTSGVLDKRTKLLTITPAGEQMVKKVSSKVSDIAQAILSPLSSAERKTLLTLLAKLNTSENIVRQISLANGDGAARDPLPSVRTRARPSISRPSNSIGRR